MCLLNCKILINENLEKINSKDVDRDSRMNATEEILKLTVSISMFRCRKHDSGIFADMKYRKIPVIDCNYSFDSGLDFEFFEYGKVFLRQKFH